MILWKIITTDFPSATYTCCGQCIIPNNEDLEKNYVCVLSYINVYIAKKPFRMVSELMYNITVNSYVCVFWQQESDFQ